MLRSPAGSVASASCFTCMVGSSAWWSLTFEASTTRDTSIGPNFTENGRLETDCSKSSGTVAAVSSVR